MYPNYNDLKETTSENDLKTSRKNFHNQKFLKSQVDVSRKDRDVVWLRLTTQVCDPTGRRKITVLEGPP